MRLPKYKVEFVGNWDFRKYGPKPKEAPKKRRSHYGRPSPNRKGDRNALILSRILRGDRQCDIAKELGISRQAVHQLYRRELVRAGLVEKDE